MRSVNRQRILGAASSLVCAFGVCVGAATAVAAPTQALNAENGWVRGSFAEKPKSFPTQYANVRWYPGNDESGKPHPLNSHVWDHATLLTRTQTAFVRDSGILPVAAAIAPKPYSSLAKVAPKALKRAGRMVTDGGCLALYWDDSPFISPDGKRTLVGGQVAAKQFCSP